MWQKNPYLGLSCSSCRTISRVEVKFVQVSLNSCYFIYLLDICRASKYVTVVSRTILIIHRIYLYIKRNEIDLDCLLREGRGEEKNATKSHILKSAYRWTQVLFNNKLLQINRKKSYRSYNGFHLGSL